MVYVASLCLQAKKALGSKCYQAKITKIIDTLPIDPSVSGMDVLILGPQDVTGQFSKRVTEAVEKRHPNVCVIYICANDKEQALFSSAPHTKIAKKIKDVTIQEAIKEFYGQDVSANKKSYNSSDDTVQELGENIKPPKVVLAEPEPKQETESEQVPEPVQVFDPDPKEIPVLEIQKAPAPVEDPIDVIASVKTVADWDILKKQIDRDGIVRKLMQDNNEFKGVVDMLAFWDLKIEEIWRDPRRSQEEKMAAVREFGSNRQALQATYNSVLVDKFITLIGRIVSVCTSSVEERVDEITHSVISVQLSKDEFIENAVTGKGDIADRLYEQMLELKGIEADICNMFALMHKEGMEEIVSRFDEKLPSKNEFINNALSVSAKLFKPANSVNLAESIMDGLSKGQIQLSMVADKVIALMNSLFQVIVEQHDVITYQSNVINCLRANHVESTVIRDSLLKDCFHVFIGQENTGLTATVAAYAGMLSRRRNTIVVDLSGHCKFERYGGVVTSLEDFMVERVQKPLLFVRGYTDDPERVFLLTEELKNRLSYFQYLIVVLDAKQADIIDQVGREALSISYVTNCTVDNIESIKTAYSRAKSVPNVCHKLVSIDCPVDISNLISMLGMDIAMTQLIPIPYLREMKKAALVGQQPHTYTDILSVFEEAYRV